jgi:hypothetical protein
MKSASDMPSPAPFNPLDKKNLGEKVAEALLDTNICPLPPEPFVGAGIYAIYYLGKFAPYRPVAEANSGDRYSQPIYVGKAVPAGARKGGFGLGADPGTALQRRLAEHAESIGHASNLALEDFRCRFLVVDDIWIPLAESMLIEKFRPVWNMLLDGFGNHDPGSGRHNQQRSLWDTLHPGREWAERLQDNQKPLSQIRADVARFLN